MPSASASITGPTSVDSWPGSPTLSSAMAPASMVMTLSAMSSCTNSTRAAEQRWPAEVKAEAITSLTSRSEEHTSELQSLMRISYAVFCLKKKKNKKHEIRHTNWKITPRLC